MTDLATIITIYKGSNGEATKALYAELEQIGPLGVVALNLFRACKASERAKVYRGRNYKGAAYDKKQWSMGNLCTVLSDAKLAGGISWGWGADVETIAFPNVLYVDLPTGQVSFHTAVRGAGPDYAGTWDGVRGASPDRICRFVDRVLNPPAQPDPAQLKMFATEEVV